MQTITFQAMQYRITLQQAYDLLKESMAILLDNGSIAKLFLDNLNGSPDNEWLFLSWYDTEDEPIPMYIRFIEDDQKILFDGSTIYMEDSEGDEWALTLLVPMEKKN